ncbi:MAG: RNA pyrophosphohydrolase [Variovorax sp.]|nr:RNA pyrophosphohydrolase [Variovorax sp.]
MDSESEYFRAGVGALVIDANGRVLAFRRSKGSVSEWQLPQGGVLHAEEPAKAVFREVAEETSIPETKLELVDEIEEWIGYELPEAYRSAKTERGQVQKWFLFRFSGTDSDIRPDGSEFSGWQWMTPAQLLAAAVPFRHAAYRRVFERFAAHLTEV